MPQKLVAVALANKIAWIVWALLRVASAISILPFESSSASCALKAQRTVAAVIALAASVKVDGLRRLDANDGMPPLPNVELVLWQSDPGTRAAADHLAAYIVNGVGVLSQPNLTHTYANDRSTA